MTNTAKKTQTIQKMTVAAILAAIASILFLLEIPVVLFYKLDFSNLPVLLGTFALGPLWGTGILLVKSLLGCLHSSSLFVGEFADFVVGLGMVLPAGLIYQRNKSRKGAVIGMIVGAVVASLVGVFTNVYVMIPFYGTMFHMPVEQIIGMGQALIDSISSVWEFVFYITAPFNIGKWAVISLLGILMYKPLSPLLHGRVMGMSRRQPIKP